MFDQLIGAMFATICIGAIVAFIGSGVVLLSFVIDVLFGVNIIDEFVKMIKKKLPRKKG